MRSVVEREVRSVAQSTRSDSLGDFTLLHDPADKVWVCVSARVNHENQPNEAKLCRAPKPNAQSPVWRQSTNRLDTGTLLHAPAGKVWGGVSARVP